MDVRGPHLRLFFLSLFCLLPFTFVWVPSIQSQERATKKNPQLSEQPLTVDPEQLRRGAETRFRGKKPQANASTDSVDTDTVVIRRDSKDPKGWIIITFISASAAIAGITLGVRYAVKKKRRKRWKENAKKEEPPKTCQHCTRYCHKVEIEAEHTRRMITQISYEVYNPVSEEKRQKVHSKGKVLSRLNKALSNHRRGKNPKKQQHLLENVSYMLLWQLKKWLRTEPVPCNVSFTGHLEGGKVTTEFTLYHCKRKGPVNVWEKEDKWKVTIKDKRDLPVCTLQGLDPAEEGMLKALVPELTQHLKKFIEKV